MKGKILIAALAAAIVLVPVAGYAASLEADRVSEVPEGYEEYLAEAAVEMGLTEEEAVELLERAEELRVRVHAKFRGLGYEEMQEWREERFQNRGQGWGRRGMHSYRRGPCH